MAAAGLRNLFAKIRIPGAAALRASRASGPPAMAPPPLPKGDLENALMLKNNIESAKHADLVSSADLLAKHRQQVEQTISQISERHGRVVERVHKTAVRVVCAALVVGSLDHLSTRLLERQVELQMNDRSEHIS